MPSGVRYDLQGKRFDRLLVVSRHGTKGAKSTWLCKCDCGGEKVVVGKSLVRGTTRSCGCLQKEVVGSSRRTHGMSHMKMHRLWAGMIARCTQKNHDGYHNYGGRGITVCERWMGRDGLKHFLEDMGEKPEGMSLDRIDNNGSYTPENCRWSTQCEQMLNSRRSLVFDWKGKKRTLRQWAIALEVNYDALRHRINQGWSVEEAFSKPFLSGIIPNVQAAIA